MDNDQTFEALLERVRQGDESASTELVRLYEPEVRRFVRYRLHSPRMRRFLDSLDVCQSVFAKFFARVTEGQFALQSPRQLQQLLLKMASNKLLDHARKQATTRRGGPDAVVEQMADCLVNSADQPAKAVENKELVDLLRSRMTANEQGLLDQWMNGEDWPEIAQTAATSSEAARKRVTRAIDRAAKELGWEEES
jgi:RNA polymerase sigma factor (sigma-70 family)